MRALLICTNYCLLIDFAYENTLKKEADGELQLIVL